MTRPRTVHPALVNGILLAASVPVLARRRRRRLLVPLLAAQQLRFGFALIHLHVIETLYAGKTDTDEYDLVGRRIAQRLRHGRLAGTLAVAQTVPWDTQIRGPASTDLMRLLAGSVYAVVGPSRRSAFLVFSWLGFWGLYLFGRAFAIAVPEGRSASYLRLVFMLPSIGFWTSVVGKEPWMVLTLGTAAHGSARALTGSPATGIPVALAGAGAAALMRAQAGGRLGFTVGTQIRDAGERSYLGGSRFTPTRSRSLRDVPAVAGTVLFRPHLLEAHTPQALAAAAETGVLLALTLTRLRWLAAAIGSTRRQPYVGVSLAAVAVLIAYMSRVSNFGMLTRQRVALLPFYAVLLSVPPRGR